MKYRYHNQEAIGYSKVSNSFSDIKQVAWLLLPVAALIIITYATYSQQGGESQLGQTSLPEQVSSVQAQGAGEPESDVFRNGKAVADRQSIPGSLMQNIAEALPNDVNVPLTAPPPQMTATETLPAGTLIITMDNALQERTKVRDFTSSGGNFLAQCAAVRSFQASHPRVFNSAGFVDELGLGGFQYDNPTEPSAQFEGNIPDEGGSLEDFAFQNHPPCGTRIVHDSQNDFKVYTDRIDGFTGSAGGYIHYLGGHKYDGDIDADRYYLNAVLRSADRPDQCGLTIASKDS